MADTSTTGSTSAAEQPAKPVKPPTRSPEEIAAELEKARQSLASNVDAIQQYVKPGNVAGRIGQRIKRIYVAEDGSPNIKPIAITAAVVGIYLLYRIRK